MCTCEASNRAEKGLQRRRGSRPSTRLCDRAERPRFVPGHQTLGPECAALGPSPYAYVSGLGARALAIPRHRGDIGDIKAGASAHQRGLLTARGAAAGGAFEYTPNREQPNLLSDLLSMS